MGRLFTGKGIRGRLGLAALGAVVLAVGLVPHAQAAGTRYLDEVFPELKITSDLQYGQAVGHTGEMENLLLDVIEPKGDKAPIRAAVVWVHGGYFIEGSKTVSWYKEAREQFARAGYVTFSINYRLDPNLPRGAGPAVTENRLDEYVAHMTKTQYDAQAAVRWVRAHATKWRVDPEKIAIAGHSAGGIISHLVAFNDHDPGSSGNPGYSSRVAAAVSSAGGSLPGKTVRVDPGEPPLLVAHGVADDVVPYPAEVPSCALTIALGNVCEQVLDPDGKHAQFGYAQWREFLYRRMIQTPVLSLPTSVTLVGTESLTTPPPLPG
jgi:dienelactone hydrolase